MKLNTFNLSAMLGLALSITSPANCAPTHIPDFAPKPPLGFNSYDSYLTSLPEDKANALIDVMAEKYLPYGYQYFVIDAGWARSVD